MWSPESEIQADADFETEDAAKVVVHAKAAVGEETVGAGVEM